MTFDGVGRNMRIGLNFTERGFGMRGAVGCSDRGHTAASQLKPGDIDWEESFGKEGVRWFHTGGIFAALATPRRTSVDRGGGGGEEARHDRLLRSRTIARRSGNRIGGQKRAQEVNRNIAPYVDVMIGNEEDFTACLGFEVEGATSTSRTIDADARSSR